MTTKNLPLATGDLCALFAIAGHLTVATRGRIPAWGSAAHKWKRIAARHPLANWQRAVEPRLLIADISKLSKRGIMPRGACKNRDIVRRPIGLRIWLAADVLVVVLHRKDIVLESNLNAGQTVEM
jgi:hypothetical protein